MFEPSRTEVAEAEDLLASLLTQGRAILHSPQGPRRAHPRATRGVAQRSAAASALALARLQWRPKTSVALLNLHTCQHCGTSQTVFAGFGILMYRNSDASERIVMTPQLDTAFPRDTHYMETITAGCPSCLPTRGFNLEIPNGQA